MMAFVLSILSACGSDGKSEDPPAPKILTGITLTSQPTKTQYVRGDALSVAGLAVNASYTDGSNAVLSPGNGATDGYLVSGFDPQAVGPQTITVSYQGKMATFPVTVAPVRVAVSYAVDGATTQVQVDERTLLTAPATPDKGGTSYFVGWFVEDKGQGHMWDFAHEKVQTDVVLKAKFVELSASNADRGCLPRRSQANRVHLQDPAGTEGGQYSERHHRQLHARRLLDRRLPGPHNANTPEHPGLVGISFPQSSLTFKGLTVQRGRCAHRRQPRPDHGLQRQLERDRHRHQLLRL